MTAPIKGYTEVRVETNKQINSPDNITNSKTQTLTFLKGCLVIPVATGLQLVEGALNAAELVDELVPEIAHTHARRGVQLAAARALLLEEIAATKFSVLFFSIFQNGRLFSEFFDFNFVF